MEELQGFSAVSSIKRESRHSELFILEGESAKSTIRDTAFYKLIRHIKKLLAAKSYKKLHKLKSNCTKDSWKALLIAAKSKKNIKIEWGDL